MTLHRLTPVALVCAVADCGLEAYGTVAPGNQGEEAAPGRPDQHAPATDVGDGDHVIVAVLRRVGVEHASKNPVRFSHDGRIG